MKTLLFFCICLAVVLTFDGCKKEESTPVAFTLVSAKSGTTNLNVGGSGATGVSGALNILVTFSTNIDYTTVTKTSVTLMHDTSHLVLQYIIAGNTLAIIPYSALGILPGANLTLTLTNQLKSTQGLAFAGDTIRFQTAGVGIDSPDPALLPAQVLYMPFDGTASDLTQNSTVTFAQLSYTTDRFLVTSAAGYFNGVVGAAAGTGDIVEISGNNLISPSMSISVWLNITRNNYLGGKIPVLGLAADNGYYMEIGGDSVDVLNEGPSFIKVATNHQINAIPLVYRTSVNTYAGLDTNNDTTSVSSTKPVNKLLQDGWHQIVMTYDSGSHQKTFYVDGAEIEHWILAGPNNTINFKQIALDLTAPPVLDNTLALGYYCSKDNTASPLFSYSTALTTFIGAMDDLRIFSVAMTKAQVADLYLVEQPPQ